MNIVPVNDYRTQHQSFGALRLGNGGAKRLLSSIPMDEIRLIVARNYMNDCDVLVSSKAIEVIPKDKSNILKVMDKVASGNGFTDVEMYEHDTRMVLTIDKEVSENELNKYGHENRPLVLAQEVAEFVRKNVFKWKNHVRMVNPADSIAIYSQRVNKDVDELQKYVDNYGMF